MPENSVIRLAAAVGAIRPTPENVAITLRDMASRLDGGDYDELFALATELALMSENIERRQRWLEQQSEMSDYHQTLDEGHMADRVYDFRDGA